MLLAIALVILGWLCWRTARQLEREARRVPPPMKWIETGPEVAYSADGCSIRIRMPAGPKVFTFATPSEAAQAMGLAVAALDVHKDRIIQESLEEVVRQLVGGHVVQGSQN